jgi:Methylase involved in ubiquinone/menaquinone biosynthesis
MNQLACPKCQLPLNIVGNSYKCQSNHTYDISKSKYINLLLNPDKNTNNPGDNKDSLTCRKNFLNNGYYNIISETLNQYIKNLHLDKANILDLGCGEGFYLSRLKEEIKQNNYEYYGLDISKIAIDMATKYTKDINWLVANSKNIPLLDNSIDLILALFTVVNHKELNRILNDNGYIIHVTANPYHLVELKSLIYDKIIVKSDTYLKLPFTIKDSFDLKRTISINNKEDCLNLLKMTPHYYHIKKENRYILDTIDKLDVTIDIKFTIYIKPYIDI